jgi:hypothetical protein
MSLMTKILVMSLIVLCAPVRAAHAQPATPEGEHGVEILVYKKWIGAAGDEANVEAHLVCGSEAGFQPRMVNRGKPDGWRIENVPEEGLFCSVFEVERDTFIADNRDCRDLLVLPDQGAECTLVNTKIVKRIDMLNRYGLVMLIAVMLGAGLSAVHRYTRV